MSVPNSLKKDDKYMLTTITLQPRKLTKKILLDLEKRGLVVLLKPTPKIIDAPEKDCVEPIYVSSPASGPHQLLCVRKNTTHIRLTTHSDNEELIFITSQGADVKPLYVVIAKHPLPTLREKAEKGTLAADDVLALEVAFNDPETIIFTILKETPHCEITVPGPGEAPVFYVTEPASMEMRYIDLPQIAFSLA